MAATGQYNRWADVTPDDWYYQDVMELTNTFMPDGSTLINGIPYFAMKQPRIIEVHKATSDNQSTFTLNQSYTPDPSNPLQVFFNGVQGVYDSANTKGTTLKLLSGVPIGTQVVVLAVGVPNVDDSGHPAYGGGDTKYYPYVQLADGMHYRFDRYGGHTEFCYCFGQQLNRVDLDPFVERRDIDWQVGEVITEYYPSGTDRSDPMNLSPLDSWDKVRDLVYQALHGKKQSYCIVKWHVVGEAATIVEPGDWDTTNQLHGFLFTTHDLLGLPVQLNYYYVDQWGMWQKKIQGDDGSLLVTSTSPTYVDRFFPDADATRGDLIAIIDRMRSVFYGMFTDSSAPGQFTENGKSYLGFKETQVSYNGQTIIKTNGWFNLGGRRVDSNGNVTNFGLEVTIGSPQTNVPFRTYVLGTQPIGSNPATGDYWEYDNHTIVLNSPLSGGMTIQLKFLNDLSLSKFDDVRGGLWVTSTSDLTSRTFLPKPSDKWWAGNVLDIEDERFDDGTPLINGITVARYLFDPAPYTNGQPGVDPTLYNGDGYLPIIDATGVPDDSIVPDNTKNIYSNDQIGKNQVFAAGGGSISRSQVIQLLNNFRLWCLERFM